MKDFKDLENFDIEPIVLIDKDYMINLMTKIIKEIYNSNTYCETSDFLSLDYNTYRKYFGTSFEYHIPVTFDDSTSVILTVIPSRYMRSNTLLIKTKNGFIWTDLDESQL